MPTTKFTPFLASLLLLGGCFHPDDMPGDADDPTGATSGAQDDGADSQNSGSASGASGQNDDGASMSGGESGGETDGESAGETDGASAGETDGAEESGGSEESGGETDGGSDTAGEPVCGDGVLEGDESCDDGNDVDGDGCNTDCAESGQVLWTVLGGDAGLLPSDVVIDADSDVIALGYGYAVASWVERYDADGNLVNDDNPTNGTRYLTALDNGDLPTCGAITNDGVYAGLMSPLFDEELWQLVATDPGPSQTAACGGIAVTPDGNIALAGYISGTDYNGLAFVEVLDPTGDVQWVGGYNGSDTPGTREVLWDVAVADDGRVVLVGGIDMDTTVSTDNHAWIQVFDETGALDWESTYGEADPDHPIFVAAAWDNDNDRIIVMGSEAGDALVRVYDGDGSGATNTFLDNEAGTTDLAEDVKVDANGHIVVLVTEDRTDLAEGYNIRLRKFDADLELLWDASYNGADNGTDSGERLAIDPNDNSIVVFGRDSTEGTVLRKYTQ